MKNYVNYNKTLGNIYTQWNGDYLSKLEFSILGDITEEMPNLVKEFYLQLDKYLEGKIKNIEIDLMLGGTSFQQDVWDLLLSIPYGRSVTYQDMANKLGNAKATRAVATAVGDNPVMIVVPCHRVVGSDGKLHGYRGGIEKKIELLKTEGLGFF